MEGDAKEFNEYFSVACNYDDIHNGESMDAVRGYSLQSNDYGGDEDDFFGLDPTQTEIAAQLQNSATDDEDGDNVKAPAMPTEFYYEIDSFLKMSPPKFNSNPNNDPSLSNKSQKGNKKKKDKADSTVEAIRQPQGRSLPPIMKPPQQAMAEQKVKKSKSSKGIKSGGELGKQGRTIDPQLLRDAFAYTDQLLRNAIQEEAKETTFVQQQQSQCRTIDEFVPSKREAMGMEQQYPHSGPAADHSSISADSKRRPQQQHSDRSHMSTVRSLKAKAQQAPNQAGRPPKVSNNAGNGGGDFVVAKEEETDMRRNPINYDELLANFQSGSNLERLRKELKDSQQSMQTSSRAIRNLMTLN